MPVMKRTADVLLGGMKKTEFKMRTIWDFAWCNKCGGVRKVELVDVGNQYDEQCSECWSEDLESIRVPDGCLFVIDDERF